MAEYIDIDAPIDVAVYQRNRRIQVTLRQILESNDAKYERADVRPVVRGKWRFEKGDGKTCVDGWVCSACNCGFHTNVPYFEGYNFCPNCGADMRAEEGE